MRTLLQPGPVQPARFESFCGELLTMEYTLRPPATLNDALTREPVAMGLQGGTITFGRGTLEPFRYVRPGPPDSAAHVAYFSKPFAPAGRTLVKAANATFGWDQGRPTVHIHGAWIEADGTLRGGHMLPQACDLSGFMTATVWGFKNIRVATAADAETNFTLLQPSGLFDETGNGVFARIRPNEDVTLAVEAIARQHGMRNAAVRGSMGSLIGARFNDGRVVEDYATEVMVRHGVVRDGVAELTMLIADMQGHVHEGVLVRGENPVLITFDLVLEAVT